MTEPPTLVDPWPRGALTEMRQAVMLRRRFPDTVMWYGRWTRHWWAAVAVRGRWRLVEAVSPDGLVAAIVRLRDGERRR